MNTVIKIIKNGIKYYLCADTQGSWTISGSKHPFSDESILKVPFLEAINIVVTKKLMNVGKVQIITDKGNTLFDSTLSANAKEINITIPLNNI